MLKAGSWQRAQKFAGTVESLSYYPELRVLETQIALSEGWPGHAAGQFAFATSNPKEGAHLYDRFGLEPC